MSVLSLHVSLRCLQVESLWLSPVETHWGSSSKMSKYFKLNLTIRPFDGISEGAWKWLSYMFLIFCRFHIDNDDVTSIHANVGDLFTATAAKLAPRRDWHESACVTPLTSCTVESEIPDFTFCRRTVFVALLWLIYLSYISVAFFWWCTIVNWASLCMLW